MDVDEGDVLRNLPRSRPGTRSDRRTGAATGRRPRRAAREARPEEPAHGGGLVAGGLRTAVAGLTVASGLTREVLRRLPRP